MAVTHLPARTDHFGLSIKDLGFSREDSAISRRYILTGYIVTALFLGSIFMWAALVPISRAAIAPGVVGKEGYRQTVQHLEGGIIHKLLVKDGDPVEAGQVLLELADVQSRADFDLLQKQKMVAMAKEATLLAAQQGKVEVTLPAPLQSAAVGAAVRDAINGQVESSLLDTRLYRDQLEIIDRQIEGARGKIAALNGEKRVLQKSITMIREELGQYMALHEKGLVTRQVIFDLQRHVVDTEAAISSNNVALQSTAQEINDLEREQSRLTASHFEAISAELDAVRAQLVGLDEKLSKTVDTLERTVIRAPTAGVVVNLQVNTVGGVISSGQPLMDIVPNAGKLMVDARVNPIDRDTVQVGQDAEIRFSAFNRRTTEPVAGRVTLISADSLTDAVTNQSYYLAKIELLEDPAEAGNGGSIFPGMQADVFIVTGSRTALSYLTEPIVRSFSRAFRED
ncbi:MAG: HlyD family type I secretion periplasmic adaptor subunit [Woeseia sp.]